MEPGARRISYSPEPIEGRTAVASVLRQVTNQVPVRNC
jgi:hypothetical protein